LTINKYIPISQRANNHSAPGDPSDDTYVDKVPPAINAFLSFVGLVKHHHTIPSFNTRMFGTELSIFEKITNNQATHVNSQILCIIPDTPRWKNFKKLPTLGSYVQVTGQIVGVYKIDSQNHLCVAVDEISYLLLSANPSTIPTNTSPTTPRKRLRRRGEPSSASAQTKQPLPQEEAPTTPTPNVEQDLEKDDDAAVNTPDTEGTTREDDEGHVSDMSPRRTSRQRKGKRKV